VDLGVRARAEQAADDVVVEAISGLERGHELLLLVHPGEP
jgi:hypothetical protein